MPGLRREPTVAATHRQMAGCLTVEGSKKVNVPIASEVALKAELEFHAHSVRELQARRARHMAIFSLLALNETRLCEGALARVFQCISQTEAQFYQDVIGLVLSGGKPDGFFVEFGACDGKIINNTMMLEVIGWGGIVAEPLPKWHAALRANRSCAIDTRCVWSRSGERVRLHEQADETQASVLPAAGSAGWHEVETVSLLDLLDHHGAPTFIDFLSVDVEGGEMEVMNAFDFSRYRFGFIAIETHAEQRPMMERLFASNGYVPTMEEVSGHDSFFVPATSRAASQAL